MQNPKTTITGYVNLGVAAIGVVGIKYLDLDPSLLTLVLGALTTLGLVQTKDGGH